MHNVTVDGSLNGKKRRFYLILFCCFVGGLLSTFIKKSNIPRFNEKLIICEFKQLYLHIIFQNRLIYQLLSVILLTECSTLSSKKMHDTICKVKLLNVSFLVTNTSKPKDFQLQHTVD